MAKATGTYTGLEFEVTDAWQFYVPSLEKKYDSYEQMTNAIDRIEKAKSAVKKKKLDIDVLHSDGKPIKIVGVHAGNGSVLTTPKLDAWRMKNLYPNVPWIKDAIARREELNKQARLISSAIENYELYFMSIHSFDSSQYAKRIEAVEYECESKRKAAEKTNITKAMKEE